MNKYLPVMLALSFPLVGCQTAVSQLQSSGTMGPADAAFANAAYAIAQLDEQAGKLAVTRASDPRVKDVASTMSAEAQVLYPNLQATLQAEQKPVPKDLPADLTAQIQKMSQLSGPAFDKAFVATELAAHQHAVDILKNEDTATKDGALRSQVETQLPAVQGNLDKLKFLSSDLASPSQG